MSDTMLLGVLRMPVDPATAGPLEIMQYVARGQAAADRIEADEVKIRSLQAYAKHLEDVVMASARHSPRAKSLIDELRRQSGVA